MARLRHIAMAVPDPQKAAKFYVETFGMTEVGRTESELATGVYLSDGVVNLALLKYRTDGIIFDISHNGWVGTSG